MITKLRIRNFKRFQDTTIELRPFTVLMGENGSGKTTILQALTLGIRLLATTDFITSSAGRPKIRAKGIAFRQLPGIQSEDASEIFYARRARGGQQRGTAAINLDLTDVAGNVYQLQITSQFGSYNVKFQLQQSDLEAGLELIKNAPLFLAGFVGLPSVEERLFPMAIEDRLLRGGASDILRNLLLDVASVSPESYNKLRLLMRSEFNFIIELPRFSDQEDRVVHSEYVEAIGRAAVSLDLSTAGSGFLQVLQILTAIYRSLPRAKVILLDEPDAHLHPNLQRTVARVLQKLASEEGIQIILSTHSVPIIREADPGNVVPVSAGTEWLRPLMHASDVDSEIEARLDNFIVAKARLAQRILFIEDDDTKILKKILKIVSNLDFEAPGMPPVVTGIGRDSKLPFQVRETLKLMTGSEVSVLFFRDGDGLSDQYTEDLHRYADKNRIKLIILPMHEIESTLLSPTLFARCLGQKGVDVEIGTMERLMTQTMGQVISQSKFGFDIVLRDGIYKTKLVLGQRGDLISCENEARNLRGQYEAYDSFEELVRVAPGKEVLNIVRREIFQEYKVDVREGDLLGALKIEDIAEPIAAAMKGLAEFLTQDQH